MAKTTAANISTGMYMSIGEAAASGLFVPAPPPSGGIGGPAGG
ncbi:hypothetical protein [Daejeonia sp. YH14]